ncbi:hypothetical protein TNCV_2340081 [Trichonephila clavipes]|nr:hypothetical protein TNCV_2340081 [Trichonephila clavipes]
MVPLCNLERWPTSVVVHPPSNWRMVNVVLNQSKNIEKGGFRDILLNSMTQKAFSTANASILAIKTRGLSLPVPASANLLDCWGISLEQLFEDQDLWFVTFSCGKVK